MSSPVFHAGERAVQERLGLGDSVEQFARRVIRPYMPAQHRDFYQQLPFLVMAARDKDQRPWVTLLAGAPGFIQAVGTTGLTLGTTLTSGNPLAHTVLDGADVGLLGIELNSRRRNRVNGRLRTGPDAILRFETKQSFGNCPQYITQRQWVEAPLTDSTPSTHKGSELTAAQKQWIAGADTFFIGTGYQGAEESDANGMDASHRGGPPGFTEVIDGRTLVFPDFAGNNHFNTIGNLVLDPRVALVFVDFEQGHLLHLSGTAQIDWHPAADAQRPGAQRLVVVHIDAVIEQQLVLPIRWATPANDELSLRVTEKIKESDSVTSFVLENSGSGTLPTFVPGQHLPIAVPGPSGPVRRTYSLSSSPNQAAYRVSVKREPQGLASRQLHDHLDVGDLLSASRPAGDFVLQDSAKPVILISAGVGITPMLSMLRHLVETKNQQRIVFVHGARNGQQQAFASEVQQLAAEQDSLCTALLLSQPTNTDTLGGNYDRQGQVSAALIADLHPTLDGNFYLCGPTAMLSAVTSGLMQRGVADEHIHFETFGPTGS